MNRENFSFVIIKTVPNILGQELKTVLFTTDDLTFAKRECARLTDELDSHQRYHDLVQYHFEKVPKITPRKSRHPFMRGMQRDFFNGDEIEKDGNK